MVLKVFMNIIHSLAETNKQIARRAHRVQTDKMQHINYPVIFLCGHFPLVGGRSVTAVGSRGILVQGEEFFFPAIFLP